MPQCMRLVHITLRVNQLSLDNLSSSRDLFTLLCTARCETSSNNIRIHRKDINDFSNLRYLCSKSIIDFNHETHLRITTRTDGSPLSRSVVEGPIVDAKSGKKTHLLDNVYL